MYFVAEVGVPVRGSKAPFSSRGASLAKFPQVAEGVGGDGGVGLGVVVELFVAVKAKADVVRAEGFGDGVADVVGGLGEVAGAGGAEVLEVIRVDCLPWLSIRPWGRPKGSCGFEVTSSKYQRTPLRRNSLSSEEVKT